MPATQHKAPYQHGAGYLLQIGKTDCGPVAYYNFLLYLGFYDANLDVCRRDVGWIPAGTFLCCLKEALGSHVVLTIDECIALRERFPIFIYYAFPEINAGHISLSVP